MDSAEGKRKERDSMFTIDTIVKSIAGLGTVSVFLQTSVGNVPGANVSGSDWITHIGDLGVKSLLIVAVVILWKKLQEREDLILNLFKTMADVLATNKANTDKMTENLNKMSEILDDIKDGVERISPRARVVTTGT